MGEELGPWIRKGAYGSALALDLERRIIEDGFDRHLPVEFWTAVPCGDIERPL
jgi:hypothetical protein